MVLLILGLKIVENKLKLWEIEEREMVLLILGWKIVKNELKLWEIRERSKDFVNFGLENNWTFYNNLGKGKKDGFANFGLENC